MAGSEDGAELPPSRERDAAAPADAGLLTVPNAITFARLCAVPATVWLIARGRFEAAFWVFALAGLSDGLDGWWARARNARSAVGAVLDPVADKALLVCVFVMLAVADVLPDWIAILVVFRDALIVGGALALGWAGRPPVIRPLPVSKLNTALQIALAAAALAMRGFGWQAPLLLEALIWLTAATTLTASGAMTISVIIRVRAILPRTSTVATG